MRKCLRYFGQFSLSFEVAKLWIRRKWRHTHEYTKHFTAGFLYIFLLILWRKNLYKKFTEFLTIFHELMKLQDFEWLTCVPTKVMSSTQMNIHNMLIITYMLTFGIFGQYLWFVMKKVHFKQELLPWPQVPLKKFE